MQDLNFYLKELRLLKDSPNIEQLLRELENKEDKQDTVRSLVTEVLAQFGNIVKIKNWSHGQRRLASQSVFSDCHSIFNKPIFLIRALRNFYVVSGSVVQKTF